MDSPFEDLLQSFSDSSEYAKYLTDVEYEFYSADNDTEALRLAIEAKEKGYSHCFFDYVIGFCYNNGKGGVYQDKRKAGQYFRVSADVRDANDNLYNDKHADESRATLVEDFVLRSNQFGVMDVTTVISYCNVLIEHERYVDDSLMYLSMIYGRPQFGCFDVDKALVYCERLSQSTDADNRNRAASMKQALLSMKPKQSKSIFGIFNKH